MFFPGRKNSACHWSPIGSGSEEDNEIYLRYYAGEETRQRWFTDFGDPLPESQLPPHPRPWFPVWNPYEDADESSDD